MSPSDYTVQEHIAEMQRVAAQVRLAREAGIQPNVIALWLNRLSTALHRQESNPQPQPELMPMPRTANPCVTLPELCIDEAWC